MLLKSDIVKASFCMITLLTFLHKDDIDCEFKNESSMIFFPAFHYSSWCELLAYMFYIYIEFLFIYYYLNIILHFHFLYAD